MTDNRKSDPEKDRGVSFNLSGSALTTLLSLLIILVLVMNLIGCVPVDATTSASKDGGSVCVVWGTPGGDGAVNCKVSQPPTTKTGEPSPQ